MNSGESKDYKALYFDIRTKDLKIHYSKTNPNGAYKKIKSFFIENDFSHEQYSGYHSKFKTTDLIIFDLILEISRKLPWLRHCINHFEVTDIGPNHNLMDLILKSDNILEVLE
ncbi:hypothetical protein [Breznakia pachnodae]|uniref:Virulence-associated protein VapD n=1 Tax=Breznakia pachnodae TaxID=265178 RepID=A0ABU0E817_9FIRM|nr:hypothetical protein [Breznakia pachnodae]MDQ0363043.1 virulence-associated protein VapD [Breznakia pachnodae]